ncbi:DnaB-like helicase C-terminal domain-containing protein [Nocardia sp. NPDC059246]|uniref:DnaB-like helicase C-terminal domain-containing protein n=1 Tax=unclassified Nocardia TaxID=2637762 RepID=UPI00368431C5
MYTLNQSRRVRGSAGEPLPIVWEALAEKGAIYRRGQLVLICAGPGTGKSGFILNYILEACIPTLYFSADSDAFTQVTRAISKISGITLEESAVQFLRDEVSSKTWDALNKIPLRMVYEASPDLDTIEVHMQAYEEVYGDYPSAVIVDNITNVHTDSETSDASSGLEGLMDYLHTMGRNTEACVFCLHHVQGPYNDADKPIPLSGIKNQIGRVPEMVQTLHKKRNDYGPDTLCVSTVKNRGGRVDPSGEDFAELEFTGETMQIRDFATR